ncbi:MAG: hypothetical protein JWM99_1880 [Verrucomicrobiales bacterium]|nr:hypothetical protein [Verrucomicrobiales bacterium]
MDYYAGLVALGRKETELRFRRRTIRPNWHWPHLMRLSGVNAVKEKLKEAHPEANEVLNTELEKATDAEHRG